MKIDFSTPMTFYELVAIILAAVAIIIPIAQTIWKKWFVPAELNYYPTGRAFLFFNQSGSYIRIDGVFESERKSISIKKVKIKITRERDELKLNLAWSSLISPVSQSVNGNYMYVMEAAHLLRLEANSFTCAFIEFGDAFNAFGKTFNTNAAPLFKQIDTLGKTYKSYDEASAVYKNTPEYLHAKEIIRREFFWEIGKYDIDIEVYYNDEIKHFCYSISVGELESSLLKNNIDESLLSPLKSHYDVKLNYYTPTIELKENLRMNV